VTTAVLIDDHAVFREGLKLLFEAHSGPRVVGESSRPEEAADLVAATAPDVVVLDMMFPAGVDGVAVASEVLRRQPAQRILFLSMTEDAAKVSDALRAGALGYITKDQGARELLEAIDVVARGGRYVPDHLRRALEQYAAQGGRRDRLSRLTAREREVFDLTVAGLTAHAAGDRLGISARTVETHRARILSKLHAHSAADLVRIAAETGVLAD
jgi:DNA-binding NarL/FixJ family response regulator